MVARILIVDDNQANLLALEETLRPLGAEVVRANSGQDALLQLLQSDFAVVLLDVVMPDFDGLQTAALIKQRERSRGTPIIFLSAESHAPNTILDGYSHGAVDYLLKPFDPKMLRAKVAVFVDLHVQAREIERQAAALVEKERALHAARERQAQFAALLRGEELARAQAEIGERRLRALAEAIPQIVWELAPGGAFDYLSPRWCEYTGEPPARSTTIAHALELAHPDDRARAEASWREASGAGAVWELECRLRRADGEYRWHLWRSVPSNDARGAVKWYGTATDVDDQKRAIKSRDDLLATVSHDLRNPLETIVMSAELIAEDNARGAQAARLHKQIGMIDRAARRMEHLIRDLVDIASIESGRLSIEPESMVIGPLIAEAVEIAAAAARDQQIEIATALADSHATVRADRARVLQVLANLVGNAIKLTPAGGRVVIGARKSGDAITFSISDGGPGIDADELPYVFDRAGAGAGLGLAICQGIIRQHQGSIRVESGPGAGNTFSFTLPARATI